MSYPLVKIFRDEVKNFISKLPKESRQKFAIVTEALSDGCFKEVYVKQLKREIKEVKIQNYRLLFFIHEDSIYFIRIFVKKSSKAPKREIELAEKYYKLITQK